MIAAVVAVDDAPAVLLGTGTTAPGLGVLIKNEGPNTVYIGGSGVTSAAGFPLLITETLEVGSLVGGDKVYGICAAAETASLRVLREEV